MYAAVVNQTYNNCDAIFSYRTCVGGSINRTLTVYKASRKILTTSMPSAWVAIALYLRLPPGWVANSRCQKQQGRWKHLRRPAQRLVITGRLSPSTWVGGGRGRGLDRTLSLGSKKKKKRHCCSSVGHSQSLRHDFNISQASPRPNKEPKSNLVVLWSQTSAWKVFALQDVDVG